MSINFHKVSSGTPYQDIVMKRHFLAWNNLLIRWAWKPDARQVEQIPRFFMHIGQHIKEVMRQQGVTATQLAKDICCARPHIHRIFRKENIDIALLERISSALNYDFFRDLSEEFQGKV